MADPKDDMQETDSNPPTSYSPDGVNEGGLWETDLEETRKALVKENKDKMWDYAESKLSEKGFS